MVQRHLLSDMVDTNCSQNKIKKINKKLKKFEHIIYKETATTCTYQPTKNLVICNAGLVNGLSEEIIFEHFSKCGDLEKILLLPGKSCCFVRYQDSAASVKAFMEYNGTLNIAQDSKPIYILFCNELPENPISSKNWNEYPPGLAIIENFITPQEEHSLVELFDFNNLANQMKHRQVLHFGYEFKYDINNVHKNLPLDKKIPSACMILFERLKNTKYSDFQPDQLTVNYYKPGQGIPCHIDTHSAFEDPIMSLSLLSDIVMEFKKNENINCVKLPRCSLTIMNNESRYAWNHGIMPRKFDIIATDNGLSTLIRGDRISLTFRKILHGQCQCKYKDYCDSVSNGTEIEREAASTLEKLHVHDVYEKIATHFSDTRNKLWCNVVNFIESFPLGSLLIDIGCGNGKYLNQNKNCYKIGCDTSFGLLNVCKDQGFEVLSGNCLSIPLRDNTADGVICIAVIHHLGNEGRRIKAVEEIVRVLKKGGSALIYVWARDQFKDGQKTSYIKQERKNRKTEEIISVEKNKFANIACHNKVSLPVHVNRTQFKHKDLLVPWKMKNVQSEGDKNIYLRYYHVFDENELEKMCSKISNVQILNNYYDEGNWCVIIKKI